MLTKNQRLSLAKSTVIREDGEKAILFNSLSDEMFALTPDVLAIINLCDGKVTLGQIETFLSLENSNFKGEEGRTALRRFFCDMLDRGILERIDS